MTASKNKTYDMPSLGRRGGSMQFPVLIEELTGREYIFIDPEDRRIREESPDFDYDRVQELLGRKFYIWPNGGGLVEKPDNVDPRSEVDETSIVLDDAIVKGRARILKHSTVSGRAHISGSPIIQQSYVRDDAKVWGKAVIYWLSGISGKSSVGGRAKISRTKVEGRSKIHGKPRLDNCSVRACARVYGAAELSDTTVANWAVVRGEAVLQSNCEVLDHAVVEGDALLYFTSVFDFAHVLGSVRSFGSFCTGGGRNTICDKAEVRGRARIEGGEIWISDTALIEGHCLIQHGSSIWGNAHIGGVAAVQASVGGNSIIGGYADVRNSTIKGWTTICDNARVRDVSTDGSKEQLQKVIPDLDDCNLAQGIVRIAGSAEVHDTTIEACGGVVWIKGKARVWGHGLKFEGDVEIYNNARLVNWNREKPRVLSGRYDK